MTNTAAIYAAMRASEMNAWVGGADPELVGVHTYEILRRHMVMWPGSRILDFGCGIGRVTTKLLAERPDLARVTGVDIMPPVVAFCDAHIATAFSNADFQLLSDSNHHYDRHIGTGAGAAMTKAQFARRSAGVYGAAYAFSVFTHVDVDDFAPLLRFVGSLLPTHGQFLFTAFILTPASRKALAAGEVKRRFPKGGFSRDGRVFVGDRDDRLAFIAYDMTLLEEMIISAGLIPATIEYGGWRADGFSPSLQDVVVCRKAA